MSAGAKAFLDLPRTLEHLETLGVPVLGWRTDEFPMFWCVSSGLPVPHRSTRKRRSQACCARNVHWGCTGGVLSAVPIPAEAAIDRAEIEVVIASALATASRRRGAAVTPHVLAAIGHATGGRTVPANLALAEHNAAVAAAVAAESLTRNTAVTHPAALFARPGDSVRRSWGARADRGARGGGGAGEGVEAFKKSIAIGAVLALTVAACGGDDDDDDDAAAARDETRRPQPRKTTAAARPSRDTRTLDEECEEATAAGVTAPEGFSVRLVTDIGRVDDGTFNQYAYDAMEAAAECFGFETSFIETQSEADYAANIATTLSANPASCITVGFLLGTDTLAAAEANPEVNFIGIDQFQAGVPRRTTSASLFREDQGGYLAGTMAALLSESGVVGVVGGREDVPPVVRFVNAYEIGCQVDQPRHPGAQGLQRVVHRPEQGCVRRAAVHR